MKGMLPIVWPTLPIMFLAVVGTQSFAMFGREEPAHSAPPKTACNSAIFQEDQRAGQRFLSQGHFNAAVANLEKAHQMCPSDYPVGRDLVIAYDKAGSSAMALTLATEMVRQHDVAELHAMLGELDTQAGDHRAAAEQYKAATQLDPSEDNIFDYGSSLQEFEGDSALRVFRFGVGKYPASEEMHLGLGSALYGQGLVDEGVAEVYKASTMNPSDPEPMEVLGQMAHIPAPLSTGIIDRFSALHGLYPRNARLTFYYAMAISGRWSDEPASNIIPVVELLEKAIELDPRFAEAHFQLGEFYQEQGRLPNAVHAYQIAAKLDPKEAGYHYRLALAYKRCGHQQESREEMQIYQKLHSETK